MTGTPELKEPLRTLELAHGRIALPCFLPDATFGVVRSVDATDLMRCGIQAVVMNTFHLMQRPGSSTVKALGGLHQMAGWNGPIVTDSGGFQAYSLIHARPRFGQITNDGLIVRPEGGTREFRLTPEKAVQLQIGYGSDVVICLDDCTHPEASLEEQQASVRRTIEWAKRCKLEFVRILGGRKGTPDTWPLLFAVIQGGRVASLRQACATALLEIGFDGFGYGGWPTDSEGKLVLDMLAYSRELVPERLPMHALGIGHPRSVVSCARLGYNLFDSAMPTRDARHGRLYATTEDWMSADWATQEWFAFTYVGDDKHIKARTPVSEICDCACCVKYSLGYLHHLFKLGDALYLRLATIHNLRFMTDLMERIRNEQGGYSTVEGPTK